MPEDDALTTQIRRTIDGWMHRNPDRVFITPHQEQDIGRLQDELRLMRMQMDPLTFFTVANTTDAANRLHENAMQFLDDYVRYLPNARSDPRMQRPQRPTPKTIREQW